MDDAVITARRTNSGKEANLTPSCALINKLLCHPGSPLGHVLGVVESFKKLLLESGLWNFKKAIVAYSPSEFS